MTKGELVIHFGDVFIHRFRGDRSTYVILGLGQEDWFYAAQVMKIDGKEALGLPGTSEKDSVERMIGRWNLARITNAINNNFGATERVLRILEENEKSPPRKIR